MGNNQSLGYAGLKIVLFLVSRSYLCLFGAAPDF